MVGHPFHVGQQVRGHHAVRPPPATASARMARKFRLASGSSAATGSSSSSSLGFLARVSARASWARWPPDSEPAARSSGIFSDLSRSLTKAASQRRFRRAPMPMWSSAVNRRYSGISWARKPTSARKAGCWRGMPPSTVASPRGRPGQPGQQAEQRGLARAVRADQRGDPPLRDGDAAIAQRGDVAVLLASPRVSIAGIMRSPPRAARLQRDTQERLDRFVVEPGLAGLPYPPGQAAAKPRMGAGRRPGRAAPHERAVAGPGFHQALALQVAVGLEHRVRVEAVAATTSRTAGSLSPTSSRPIRRACRTCCTICRYGGTTDRLSTRKLIMPLAP